MTGAQAAGGEVLFQQGRQGQQAHHVGDGGSILAQPPGQRLFGIPIPIQQGAVGLRFLDRIERFALNIFHQRGFEQVFIGNLPQHRRNGLQAQQAHGPQAPFARNQLIAVGISRFGAHHQGLKHALGFDGSGQGFDRLRREVPPGLERVGLDAVRGQVQQLQRLRHFPGNRPWRHGFCSG